MSDFQDRPPTAIVEKIGRRMHLVYVTHGLMRYGVEGYGRRIYGQRRAERYAQRLLAKYMRSAAPPNVVARFTAPTDDGDSR